MVEDILEKYSVATTHLKGLKEIRLFAVVKMDDVTDRWSLLFGISDAKDLDKRKVVFNVIRRILIDNLKTEDIQDISRIGLFSLTDHVIKDLKKFPEKQVLKNIKANGNFVHEGYILISGSK